MTVLSLKISNPHEYYNLYEILQSCAQITYINEHLRGFNLLFTFFYDRSPRFFLMMSFFVSSSGFKSPFPPLHFTIKL